MSYFGCRVCGGSKVLNNSEWCIKHKDVCNFKDCNRRTCKVLCDRHAFKIPNTHISTLGCDITETPEGTICGVEGRLINECSWCKKLYNKKLQQCARCGTFYCGRKCQLEHWIIHKKQCARIRKEIQENRNK